MREIAAIGIISIFLLSMVSLNDASAQSANTCGINFVSGNFVTYGNLQSGTTSSEQTITLSNPGTVAATLSANGTNWVDGTQTNVMNVGNTKFANSTGTYSAKTPLTLSLQNIGTLQPSVNTNTYWQLQANLLSSSFTGNLTQAMNFRVSCDGGQSGGPANNITLDVGTKADGTVQGTVTRSSTITKLGTYSWTTNAGSIKVNTAGANEWALSDGDFTVNFWLYLNQLGGNRYIWQHTPQSSAGTNPYFFTQSASGGDLIPFIYPDNNSTGYYADSTPLSTGTWYMATAVRNTANDSYCLYVNSALQKCVNISDSITFSNAQSDWCLMNYNCQTGSDYALDGYMDDMAVWGQALTQTQINTLYNVGSGNTADTLDLASIKVYWNFEQDPASAAPQLANVAPDTVSSGSSQLTILAQQTSYTDSSLYGLATSGTGNSKGGIKVNVGSTLIGKTVNTIEFPIIRSGSPTGTYYAEVYTSDGSTLKYTFGSGDIATLSSSAVTWKTFTNTASSYTIAPGDKIVMRFSGGTHATNDLSLKYAESPSGSYDGTNTTFCYGNTCQNELTDADAAFKLWHAGSPPPPQTFQDNFSSSSGWTQYGSTVSVNNGRADAVSTLYSSGDRIVKDIGFVLGDQFTVDFDSQFVSTQNANNGDEFFQLALSSVATPHPNSGSADFISTTTIASWGAIYYFGASSKDDSNTRNAIYCGPTSTTMAQGTTYYYRMQRTTATNVDFKVYTDSARTNLFQSCSLTIPPTIDDLRYIHIGAAFDTGSFGTRTFWTDNISILP